MNWNEVIAQLQNWEDTDITDNSENQETFLTVTP